MSSQKKNYVQEHEEKFCNHSVYCPSCHHNIKSCYDQCPNCGFTLKKCPRRWPIQPDKLNTNVFEDE